MPNFQHFEKWVELTRVKKFAGTMLVFWPYAWSLGMVARKIHLPPSMFISLTIQGFVGAILHHSEFHSIRAFFTCITSVPGGPGCVWNDILDRDLDRKVERTKHRPIADGRISVAGACAFLMAHIAGLLALLWRGNVVVWRLGLIAIFVLAGLYPLMKRITYWPQAYLGFAVNVGVPLAAAILEKTVSSSTIILCVAAWSWTMWYDTIYGCQDIEDDVKAGVKSTATLFQGQGIKSLLFIFGLTMVLCFTICGVYNEAGPLYFIISVGGSAYLLGKELWQVDLKVPSSCLQTFNHNGFITGTVVWLGVVLDYLHSTYAG